jgi:hypothetical protein
VFPVAQAGSDETEFMAAFGQRVADNLLEHTGQTAEQRIDRMLNMCKKEFRKK